MVEAISARCSALLNLVLRVGFEPLSVSALRGRRFQNPKSREKLGMQPFGAGVVSADSIFGALSKWNARWLKKCVCAMRRYLRKAIDQQNLTKRKLSADDDGNSFTPRQRGLYGNSLSPLRSVNLAGLKIC